jgi:ketosteroid isomerase-like protein
MTTPTPTPADRLPTTVREYLAAHAAREVDTALRAFAPDAVVTDEGRTFRGTEQVRDFLGRAGSQFTFTTTLTGAERVDERLWVATQRLEGDFPGGLVDLHYRFTLDGGLVTALDIAPS